MSRKSERVVAAAVAATPPWEHDTQSALDGTKLRLFRGEETILITWDANDGLVHPLSYRLSGVRDTKLRNVAEALRFIAGKPDYKPKAIRSAARKTSVSRTAGKAVELGLDEMEDKEIIRLLRGKTLTWWSPMQELHESGSVPDRKLAEVPDGKGGKKKVWRTSPNIYMSTSSAGRRILTFPAVGEQFRSIGLDQIVNIS
jgi:hypothetical protein